MNIAGVVAGPKSVTDTPFAASPAASAAASAGPDSRGSRPTCNAARHADEARRPPGAMKETCTAQVATLRHPIMLLTESCARSLLTALN